MFCQIDGDRGVFCSGFACGESWKMANYFPNINGVMGFPEFVISMEPMFSKTVWGFGGYVSPMMLLSASLTFASALSAFSVLSYSSITVCATATILANSFVFP
jgi:hypothetical protein